MILRMKSHIIPVMLELSNIRNHQRVSELPATTSDLRAYLLCKNTHVQACPEEFSACFCPFKPHKRWLVGWLVGLNFNPTQPTQDFHTTKVRK